MSLRPAPASLFDPISGALHTGTYEGGLARVDLSPVAGPFRKLFVRKKWMYVAIIRPPIFVCACVVDVGYSKAAFAYVYDDERRRMLADVSTLGVAGGVTDSARDGFAARLASRGLMVDMRYDAGVYSVRAKGKGLDLNASLDAKAAPEGITGIREVDPNRWSTTEKRALLEASGSVQAGGDRFDLAGGLAGYDYTHGLLPRRTRWQWAFLIGKGKGGAPVAVNLVEGFMRETECAIFTESGPRAVGEGHFRFDAKRPLERWSVGSHDGAVSLEFSPGAMHREARNLILVRSRFVQPVGSFSGTISLGDEQIELSRALGVVEDQDVLW